MKVLPKLLILALCAGYLAGCNPGAVNVEDDMKYEIFEEKLHTPYVVGTSVEIAVDREDRMPIEGWDVRSMNPNILSIDTIYKSTDGRRMHLSCKAAAPGETQLMIYDHQGNVKTSRWIRVEMPDELRLLPAGLQKILHGRAPSLNLNEPILLLDEGKATFEVEYYKEGQRLFGNGALKIQVTDYSMTAKNLKTYWAENREWLQVKASRQGATRLWLKVGGQTMKTIYFDVVDPTEVQKLQIDADNEYDDADDGGYYLLLARAFDWEGREIFGVAFDWDADGVYEGNGDLYEFRYREGALSTITVSGAGLTDHVQVEMDYGNVSSSNRLGCGIMPGSLSSAALFPFLAIFGLLIIRRKRGGK